MLFRLSKDQGFSSGIAILLLLFAAVGAIGYTSRFITEPDPEMLAFTATSSQRGAILAARLKNNGDSVIDESGNGLYALERAAAAMQVSLRDFSGYNAVAYGIQTNKLSLPNCAVENVNPVTKLCAAANGATCPDVNEKITRKVKALAAGNHLCLNNAFVALSVIGKDGNLVGDPWVTIASTGASNRTVARYNASLGSGAVPGLPAGGPVGVGVPPLGPPPGGGGDAQAPRGPGDNQSDGDGDNQNNNADNQANLANAILQDLLDTWIPTPVGSGIYARPSDPYDNERILYNSLNQTFIIPDSDNRPINYKLDLASATLINLDGIGPRIPLSSLVDSVIRPGAPNGGSGGLDPSLITPPVQPGPVNSGNPPPLPQPDIPVSGGILNNSICPPGTKPSDLGGGCIPM